jgi:L-lactate dehydrogenase
MATTSIRQALHDFDATGSGQVSATDLKKLLQSLGLADDDVEKLLAALGTSAGGTVKIDDFLKFLGIEEAEKHTAFAPSHVAVVGAGFVGTSAAFAMCCHETAARITLTDVNTTKCEGEVLDLEDGARGSHVAVASLQEAGKADIIVITAGRGQKEGESRLDLIAANSAIMKSIILGMQPIKSSAKIIVVSNPCDALTYVAQDYAGLPITQVFGSGTLLDSKRLAVSLAKRCLVNPRSMAMFVLGEHGDSQFPVASLANIGGVPLLKAKRMHGVDLAREAKQSANKAYSIIQKKGYTAFGIGRAVMEIVDCILKDKQTVLPVSVRVPGQNCCLSLPCVVGFNGIHSILEQVISHFSEAEAMLYAKSIMCVQEALGTAAGMGIGRQISLSVLGGPVQNPQPAECLNYPQPMPDAGPRLKGMHVAVIGAGFVGTSTAFALLCAAATAHVTLTDVNAEKCLGEVLDLEDGDGRVEMASSQEAGQADIIVITAGRGQREGETRLDLLKANSAIMRSIIAGMQPIKQSAKIIVVSNPCDALTFVAQESAGLPLGQVFGSGTVLDSRRLCTAVAHKIGVSPASVNLLVLGEHGDSQFPAASLATIGGVPLQQCQQMVGIDLADEARRSASKAYSIIKKKGYTSFGVAQAVVRIIRAVVGDEQQVLPVSVRVPNKNCCLSLPCVVGINGVERAFDHVAEHFTPEEKAKYDSSIETMEEVVQQL